MTRQEPSKSDRALELHEKGISSSAIMERLGFNSVQAVCVQILKAKERRAKKAGEVVG